MNKVFVVACLFASVITVSECNRADYWKDQYTWQHAYFLEAIDVAKDWKNVAERGLTIAQGWKDEAERRPLPPPKVTYPDWWRFMEEEPFPEPYVKKDWDFKRVWKGPVYFPIEVHLMMNDIGSRDIMVKPPFRSWLDGFYSENPQLVPKADFVERL